MLLRLWTTRVDPAREAAYLAYAHAHSRPMFLAQDGCLGVFFLRGADGRHTACSIWRNAAAVDQLARSTRYRETAAGLAATGALVGDPEVAVFTVTGGAVADALAAALAAAGDASAAPPGG